MICSAENSTKTAPESARGLDFSQDLLAKGWYHSFEFPDGAVIDGYMPLAVQKERYSRYPIPGRSARQARARHRRVGRMVQL